MEVEIHGTCLQFVQEHAIKMQSVCWSCSVLLQPNTTYQLVLFVFSIWLSRQVRLLDDGQSWWCNAAGRVKQWAASFRKQRHHFWWWWQRCCWHTRSPIQFMGREAVLSLGLWKKVERCWSAQSYLVSRECSEWIYWHRILASSDAGLLEWLKRALVNF